MGRGDAARSGRGPDGIGNPIGCGSAVPRLHLPDASTDGTPSTHRPLRQLDLISENDRLPNPVPQHSPLGDVVASLSGHSTKVQAVETRLGPVEPPPDKQKSVSGICP